VEVTLGTAAVALSCALRPAGDPERRVTCCAHAVPGKWEIEGLQTSAGSCIEWLSKVTNGGRRFTPAFFNGVAKVEPGARGAVFLPYLAGASAPHWMPGARGAFIGLRLGHGREELARAVMEGVSMQTREIVDVFGALGVRTREIRLTGGGTAIGAWNQMQADIFNIPVSTLRVRHATLLGAAMLAAVGAGAYASLKDAAARMVRLRRTYRPIPERAAAYARLYGRFRGLHEGTESAGVFGRCRRSS
jgi:xylulokinase